MKLLLDPSSIEDYDRFLKIKSLPTYLIRGRMAEFPDEYACALGLARQTESLVTYRPIDAAFDYQAGCSSLAIRRRKFALFMKCGMGKTICILEFSRYCADVLPPGKCVLIVSPLMVIPQTVSEAKRFYGDLLNIEVVPPSKLGEWLATGTGRIGITNWEALRSSVDRGRLGSLIGDETSLMKSHYGKYGGELIRLGRGLEWKLAATGTPAPNDRIEFANHAVFMDAFPNVNSFLARFFVNRGQTSERWELKPHALRPFYRAISHWCIFLTNPATYGWKDNTEPLPPIVVHEHDVELTTEQHAAVGKESGELFASKFGGITSRSVLSRIAKGKYRGEDVSTNKPAYIKSLVESWPGESTILWCRYNDEQDRLAKLFPDAANIDGDTPYETRLSLLEDFKTRRRLQLITKPRILGFGQNLQLVSRMVFSTCQDSAEEYIQCVGRANRYGSVGPLNVHLPVTELERPMMENVFRKLKRIDEDDREQEQVFAELNMEGIHGE